MVFRYLSKVTAEFYHEMSLIWLSFNYGHSDPRSQDQ
jgi:hypothetical protein